MVPSSLPINILKRSRLQENEEPGLDPGWDKVAVKDNLYDPALGGIVSFAGCNNVISGMEKNILLFLRCKPKHLGVELS